MGRVPVWVKDDDGVGSGDVQTESAGPGGDEEEEERRILIEVIHEFLSGVDFRAAVQSAVAVALRLGVGLKDVEEPGAVREQEDLGVLRLKNRKQAVKNLHLARVGRIGKIEEISIS